MPRPDHRLDFGPRPLFFPVIHPIGQAEGLASARIAVENGADGIFLINQGMRKLGVVQLYHRLRELYPDLWMGLNFLGHEVKDVSDTCLVTCAQGAWFDRAPEQRVGQGNFLVFGGAAFKGQDYVSPDNWASEARSVAQRVDVVTTSGPGTGISAHIDKVRVMSEALPAGCPLGLASGVTPENVTDYLPYVRAFLVATGIETSFGVLNPVRTRLLADRIRAGGPARWLQQEPKAP